MGKFQWFTEGNVELPQLDFAAVEAWLEKVAATHSKIPGSLTYIFCDDPTILDVNRKYLNHDYYTDIITFDNSLRSLLRGDIYLSLDTVGSNARQLNVPYATELHRVIVHGLLHLCGIDDKGPGEREIMERAEDEALNLLPTAI